MIGIILMVFKSFTQEIVLSVGKKEIKAGHEDIYVLGFLTLFWATIGYWIVAAVWPHTWVFVAASIPTLLARMILDIFVYHYALKAVSLASRSTFAFLRTLTLPLLLIVDLILGYSISPEQIVGILLIFVSLAFLFLSHGISRKGAGPVLFTAIAAVATTTLYKFNIEHFNSVIAEQALVHSVLLAYFIIRLAREKKNPLQYLKKPVTLGQSIIAAIGAPAEAFAFTFAPASVVMTAKRLSTIVWSMIFGQKFFHEAHIRHKMIGFLGIGVAVVLLIV